LLVDVDYGISTEALVESVGGTSGNQMSLEFWNLQEQVDGSQLPLQQHQEGVAKDLAISEHQVRVLTKELRNSVCTIMMVSRMLRDGEASVSEFGRGATRSIDKIMGRSAERVLPGPREVSLIFPSSQRIRG
jgi:hypothetical protein